LGDGPGMAEVLGIFGAVAAAVGLLELALQGIVWISDGKQRFTEYGKTVLKFKHDVQILRELLEG
jgi:uncharacterized membrane protein YfbV (UPF0208 family)